MRATSLPSDTTIWLQLALAGIFNRLCQALRQCRSPMETGLLKPGHWSEDFMVLSQTKPLPFGWIAGARSRTLAQNRQTLLPMKHYILGAQQVQTSMSEIFLDFS